MPTRRPRKTLRTELSAHFRDHGYLTTGSHSRVERRIKELMGARRYARYLATAERVHSGLAPVADLYATATSLDEAAALMSHQTAEALAAAEALYASTTGWIRPGARVADLGCFTGTFTSFLTERHPEAQVVGFDRLPVVVALAASRDASRNNLEYVTWDYRARRAPPLAPFDVLLSSFGIDFPPTKIRFSLDPERIRSGAEYRKIRQHVSPILTHWRKLATPASRCLAVLRLPHVETLTGVIDASASAGWRWRPEASSHVKVGLESFTLLAWDASPVACLLHAEANILAFDAGIPAADLERAVKGKGVRELQGTAAMLAWGRLGRTTLTSTSTRRFGDGFAMRKRMGSFGRGRFVYTIAETGFHHLLLGQASDAAELEHRYDFEFWDGADPE